MYTELVGVIFAAVILLMVWILPNLQKFEGTAVDYAYTAEWCAVQTAIDAMMAEQAITSGSLVMGDTIIKIDQGR